MPAKLTIEGRRAVVSPPVPSKLLVPITKMEGRKAWLKDSGGFSFEPTHHNMELFTSALPDAEVEDRRETYDRFATTLSAAVGQGAVRDPSLGGPTSPTIYASRTQPYGEFQTKATAHCLKNPYSGLFMEQGTGKSKVALDVAGTRWCNWEITGVLIIAYAGVHIQWLKEAIPDHLGPMVPRRTYAYKSSRKIPEVMFNRDKLCFFSINFESVFTKEGRKQIEAFITMHGGRVLCIVDEGQRIKNPDAKSTQEIIDVGSYCKFRMDLTGTPLAKDLTDIWSQFNYLDRTIFGYAYKATFRADYCVMSKKIRGMVVASKNERRFYEKIAPYVFRATKEEELDLPPKVYDTVEFELHPEQRKLYDQMKSRFMAELDNGKKATVANAAVMVMRLHQITCGYLAMDKDDPDEATQFEMLPNPRLETFLRVRRSRLGKAVTWCRFNKDIELIMGKLNTAVSYYGATLEDERQNAKRWFADPDNLNVMDFVSNPAAGGTGVDGLQKTGRTAIYYTNSYNSIHRWQSEDRTHRIGMGETCTYIDLVARNTVDGPIIKNLRKKKGLSDLVLDDIRLMIAGEYDDAND